MHREDDRSTQANDEDGNCIEMGKNGPLKMNDVGPALEDSQDETAKANQMRHAFGRCPHPPWQVRRFVHTAIEKGIHTLLWDLLPVASPSGSRCPGCVHAGS